MDAARFLDYKLMHIEYGMKQHQVGAKFGAKVCKDYKNKLIDEHLKFTKIDPIEKELFDKGFIDPNQKLNDQMTKRIPNIAKEKLEKALVELNKKLQKISDKLDYKNIFSN